MSCDCIDLDRLLHYKEAAERASRAKSELLAQVSHELRTPLNAVLGFAQLLERDPTLHLSAEQRAWLEHVRDASTHVLDLVKDLLDLSRVEQEGGRRLEIERTALRPLAKHVLSLLQPAAAEHAVSLECLEERPNACVRADARSLRQVLFNLVTNGVKYNRAGGYVVVHLRSGEIEVTDTGRGLAPRQIACLFEPFNRLGAQASGIPGSGLGLVITKQLVEAMGGAIAVRSTPGHGSSFAVTLPC